MSKSPYNAIGDGVTLNTLAIQKALDDCTDEERVVIPKGVTEIKKRAFADNKYLEDKKISLKAKGLLTLMLSLPDSWKFNINGLCLFCKESKDAVRNAYSEVVTIEKK